MKNTNEFPERKRNRLKDFDYSSNGAYFVTICIKDRNVSLWEAVGADINRSRSNETVGFKANRKINLAKILL